MGDFWLENRGRPNTEHSPSRSILPFLLPSFESLIHHLHLFPFSHISQVHRMKWGQRLRREWRSLTTYIILVVFPGSISIDLPDNSRDSVSVMRERERHPCRSLGNTHMMSSFRDSCFVKRCEFSKKSRAMSILCEMATQGNYYGPERHPTLKVLPQLINIFS